MSKPHVHLNIPVAHFGQVLSWDQATIDRLVDEAIRVAMKIGLRLDDDAEGIYLEEAKKGGAKVDPNARAVLFTKKDIQETIRVMRKTSPAPKPLRGICATSGRDEKLSLGNGGNLYFDWDQWEARAPEVKDLLGVCHWAQGCDEVDALFPPFLLKDIDQRLEPIYNYALLAKYCRKRVYHEQPTEPIHVRYLKKMSRIVQKHRGYFQPMQEWEYVNPPFRMGQRSVATMLERVDSGACKSMGIGSMAVAGMSAPVTVAGLAVTALAEILAALTFFRILRPRYGLRAVVATGAIDMRTANVSYSGMHIHLGNLATWELMVRGLGAEAGCLTWYRDANEPGLQALYEFGMAQAFFSSVLIRCSPEIGGLCNGNMFSPHQAVLDMAAKKEFDELLAGFRADKTATGIEEVIHARFEQGTHLSSEHTLAHMKDGIPFSNFFFRGLPAGTQHDRKNTQTSRLMEKAAQSVEEAKAKGRAVEPDVKLSEELYGYVKEAAAELKIEAPPLP